MRLPIGFSGPTCEERTNGGRSGASGGRATTGSGGAPAATGGSSTASGGLQGTGGFDHPCFPNPCLNNGYCMLDGEDYRCDCNGYEGRLCENDVDECAQDPRRFGNQVRGVSNTGIVLGGTVVWSGEVRTAEQALQDAGVVLDQNVTSITSSSPDGRYWVGYGAGGGFLARIVKGG